MRVALTAAEREALRAARFYPEPVKSRSSHWAIRRRYSLKEIGRALGVSWKTVHRWERGERRPTSEQLEAWWKHLLGGEGNEQRGADLGA